METIVDGDATAGACCEAGNADGKPASWNGADDTRDIVDCNADMDVIERYPGLLSFFK